ncbi:MAG TPA: sugar phosphate isomerase/epimerase [Vicinamibacterales bacterium]|nr:sugar phosphate isomerase/epimerase [Vicinamibacterales bacterium]
MTRISRREWHVLMLGSLATSVVEPWTSLQAQRGSAAPGVEIGVQSYSFRDRPLEGAIDGMTAAGLTSCELWQGHVEPKGLSREDLRKWRVTGPLSTFTEIRAKFERAGIRLNAYNLSFRDDFSDEEIARGFAMAEALGAPVLTASAHQAVVRRVAPHAERARLRVGMHNHSDIKPNEFATPDDFERALAVSPMIAVNLDIGHFTAANFDALAFLRKRHNRIVTLHVKDRQRDQGPAVPFGEGDAPIREVLRLLRAERWKIPANIEYEYDGADTVAEVKRCVEYCRAAI